MKLRQLFEDGRIVKGVNTTADVGPDEIKTQARKFGNSVDKDGRPPTLSKKVKGSSTNVAYNLGMVKESVDNTSDDNVYFKQMQEAFEISKSSEIYVDMDGVLADFFTRWEQITGKNWREIKGDAIQPALQAIRDDKNFWLDLPMTSNAQNLLKLIKDVKGEYKILSAPLAGDPKAVPHKKEWVKNNLSFFPPKEVIIDSDKAKYAKQSDGTPNILIDDFGSNIAKWEAAGGIGFKHKDHKFERTAKKIKQHIEEPVEEGNIFPNPKNTFLTKSDTAYDFIKVGTNIANLKSMPPGSNASEPDIMIAPYAGKKEMRYLQKQLKRIGYDVQDAEGYSDPHFDEKPTGGEAPPQVKGGDKHGKVKIVKLKPVQKNRTFKKLLKQLPKVKENNYQPIVIDKRGRIVNGHHRYDALRILGKEYAVVEMIDDVVENINENVSKKKQSPAQWQKAMIKKYGEDGWYDITDAVRDYYESNAILDNTVNDIIKLRGEHPSFTDYTGIKKLYRYERKDKSGTPTDDQFIPFAYNIKGAKNFVQSMAQGNMGFKKDDFELVEKDFRPQDAILNFTNMIEWVHELDGDDGEWYKREYEVWMKRTPYYTGTETNENFADGKKKGKSRPGRVKKSGASCNGSVTSLRKRAKNSSGEKARMYHWCANMKSGRKKK